MAPADPNSQGKQVLIVEDDFSMRGLLSNVLIRAGYEVCVAPRAKDVWAFSGAIEPAVVVLDWKLPDADGLELLPEIKQHWPHTEVIMITGYGTPDIERKARQRGVFCFFNKPFHVENLQLAVKQACEPKSPTPAARPPTAGSWAGSA